MYQTLSFKLMHMIKTIVRGNTIAKGCLILIIFMFKNTVAIAGIPLPPSFVATDAEFLIALKLPVVGIVDKTNALREAIDEVYDSTRPILGASELYANRINEIQTAITNEKTAHEKWMKDNNPNPKYSKEINDLYDKWRNINEDTVSNSEIIDPEVHFNSSTAFESMVDVYGKSSLIYKKYIKDTKNPFCPDAPDLIAGNALLEPIAPIINPAIQGAITVATGGILNKKLTYLQLQALSCKAIYNAIAYKEKVNDLLKQKNKLFDEAINGKNSFDKGIVKLPTKTIGDYDSRQTALMTANLLRDITINDNQTRLDNADTEISIAQHTEKYASNSILTGPPKTKLKDKLLSTGVKTAIGTGLGLLISATAPYNP